MSIDDRISDALFDYCIAWRDRASAVQDKVEIELRAAIKQHVAEAVTREREECALIVQASPSYDWHPGICEAVAAIRARADNEAPK